MPWMLTRWWLSVFPDDTERVNPRLQEEKQDWVAFNEFMWAATPLMRTVSAV